MSNTTQSGFDKSMSVQSILIGIVTSVVSFGVTYVTAIWCHQYLTEEITKSEVYAPVVGGAIVLFLMLGIVGYVSDKWMIRYRPTPRSGWTWASYGSIAALGLQVIELSGITEWVLTEAVVINSPVIHLVLILSLALPGVIILVFGHAERQRLGSCDRVKYF